MRRAWDRVDVLRTDDLNYGADYWNTLDGGAGYQDSVLWEDLAILTKEILYYPNGQDLTNTHNLLDMGCAHGYLVRHLRRRGIEAWGADFSQYALDNAPDDIATYLRHYDLTDNTEVGTLAGYPFCFLTCYETLEHIPEEKVPRALFWLFHALKPGGRGLLTICTDDRPGWDSDPTHVTIKDHAWWDERFTQTGFRLLDISRIKTFHLFADHGGVFLVERPA
jgi:2-polyprenyl-3-methyl-5-hydroxy-6-metoxy-1,4-benzoquinol methylase